MTAAGTWPFGSIVTDFVQRPIKINRNTNHEMKFHKKVLLKLAPSNHNSGVEELRGMHTSLCIDLPSWPHPAHALHNCTVNQNEERHLSDAGRKQWELWGVGNRCAFGWGASPTILPLIYTHVSCELQLHSDTSQNVEPERVWTSILVLSGLAEACRTQKQSLQSGEAMLSPPPRPN